MARRSVTRKAMNQGFSGTVLRSRTRTDWAVERERSEAAWAEVEEA